MQANTAERTGPALKEAMRQGTGDAQAGADKRDAETLLNALSEGGASVSPDEREKVYSAYCRAYDLIAKREVLVDAGSAMSFPASDPPSYMGGASVAGAPDNETPTEKPSTRVSDKDELSPAVTEGGGEDTSSGSSRA